MEITYSRNTNYSMDLGAKEKRKLADHLDITVGELNELVRLEELYGEHGDGLVHWMEDNFALAEITSEGAIEIEDING
jgi:hypothetical protein